MSNNHVADNAWKPSPPRRQQISRSITELSAPIRLHRHHHHLHHIYQRRHADNRDDNPQSPAPSIQIPRSSLDLPHSEGVTPYTMSDQSRRTSTQPPGSEDMDPLATAAAAANKEKQLGDEREHAASRTAGLKKWLMGLNSSWNATTRRLDESYYALLEKTSRLQRTVLAIQELAAMSQETNEVFSTDSQGLATEIESQLDALGQFREQQDRIQNLQGRIYMGRQKAQKLSERVDLVRDRIEGWERADKEWQEKTRRRLKIIWLITSVLVLIMVLLFVGAQVTDLPSIKRYDKHSGDEVLINKNSASAHLAEDIRAALNRTRGDEQATEHEVLREFDEL